MSRVSLRPSRPLYWQLLRLRHVHPNSWQRAVLGEGAIIVAGVLVLADLASLWVLLALPLTVAAVVKAHDLLGGLLAPAEAAGPAAGDDPVDPADRGEPIDRDDESPAVRVIPAPPRKAASKPGAAAARAHAETRRRPGQAGTD